jgi:hypothetical protein
MFEIVEIDLDGYTDTRGITYIGRARLQENGKYICLANVNGCLCRVEVRITLKGQAAYGVESTLEEKSG